MLLVVLKLLTEFDSSAVVTRTSINAISGLNNMQAMKYKNTLRPLTFAALRLTPIKHT